MRYRKKDRYIHIQTYVHAIPHSPIPRFHNRKKNQGEFGVGRGRERNPNQTGTETETTYYPVTNNKAKRTGRGC